MIVSGYRQEKLPQTVRLLYMRSSRKQRPKTTAGRRLRLSLSEILERITSECSVSLSAMDYHCDAPLEPPEIPLLLVAIDERLPDIDVQKITWPKAT